MATDPHAEEPNEDPELHVGPVIPDPWEDDEQTDWANRTIEVSTDGDPD